jgi:hypothetical protein
MTNNRGGVIISLINLWKIKHHQGRREGWGQGANCPGPPGSGGPRFWGPLEIFCRAPVIFWVKYFREKGKIFVFLGKMKLKNWGKVAGKQLQRTRAEKCFP